MVCFDTVENRTRLPSALCNAYRHITQCVGIVMGGGGGGGGLPDLLGDGGIQRQMLSP